MFVITKQLREYMEKEFELAQDASEEDLRKAVWKAMQDGKMDAKKVTELTQSDAKQAVVTMISEEVSKQFSPVLGALDQIKSLMSGGNGQSTEETETDPPVVDDKTVDPAVAATKDQVGQSIDKAIASGAQAATMYGTFDQVRVKNAIEQYAHNPTAATWDKSPKAWMAKNYGHMPINTYAKGLDYIGDMPTERTKAIAGAWFMKMYCRAMQEAGRPVPQMTDHAKDIVQWTARNCQFVGTVGDRKRPTIEFERQVPNDFQTKILLDELGGSGGLEAVPIEFDAMLITTPFLTGELLPFVETRNMSRRRIEAAAIGQPTVSWGTAEGTEVGLFNTAGFITAFDNTIWPVMGAMEIGRDFLSDSPADVGTEIVRQYGQAFLSEFDTVIANGNGTDRPTGLFQTSGLSVLNTAGGAGAAPTVGDYEALMFGINKEFLQESGMPPNSRAVFLSTQTSYQRVRGLPLGTTDERRVFGMDEMSYRLFQFRYAINSSAGNANIGFFCLNRYILYRIPGVEIQIVNSDTHSARAHTETIVARQRVGGGLNHSSSGVEINDAQA